MNSITKLIIASITSVLFLQSCNMAKHYGNMRIDHDEEILINSSAEKQTQSSVQNFENKIPEVDCSITTESEVIIESTGKSEIKLAIKKDSITKKPNLNNPKITNTKQVKFKKKNTLTKRINSVKSKIKICKPGSAQKEMSVDEWGYIAIGLTVIAFIVLIILTGSFLAALILAIQFFLALISLIAVGLIIYAIGAVFSFLGGGMF